MLSQQKQKYFTAQWLASGFKTQTRLALADIPSINIRQCHMEKYIAVTPTHKEKYLKGRCILLMLILAPCYQSCPSSHNALYK